VQSEKKHDIHNKFEELNLDFTARCQVRILRLCL